MYIRRLYGLIAVAVLSAGTSAGLGVEQVVQQNEATVLVLMGIRTETGGEVQSSGCCIHPDGYIITTAHQIAGVEQLEGRLPSGATYPLSVVEIDKAREIALLKADARLPRAARIGNADTLQRGASLVSIATPKKLDFSVVTGYVSNTRVTLRDYPVIQADMRASPGSSGGPVFDSDGALIGMIIGKLGDVDWVTVVNPINNAYALLGRHGLFAPPVEGSRGALASTTAETELVPAPGITEKEWRAVQAYNRGVALQDPQGKAAAYQLAVTLLPSFFEAWFNLAVAAAAAGDEATAESAYRRAGALNAASVEVQRNLGLLLLRGKRVEEALACFKEALRMAPEEPQSYNDLGEAYRLADRAEEAVQAFEQALQRNPDYVLAHYNLALTCAKHGQPERAIEHFEAYLGLAPGASDADQIRGWIQELREHSKGK